MMGLPAYGRRSYSAFYALMADVIFLFLRLFGEYFQDGVSSVCCVSATRWFSFAAARVSISPGWEFSFLF